MKLRNLKYALFIGAFIGANESYAAVTTMAYDLDNSAAAYTMTRAGSFYSSATTGAYTGDFLAASAAGAVAYIDSANDLTINTGAIGAAGTPVALGIMSTGKVTLATATLYGMPADADGNARGALQLMGGGTVAMTGAATAFTASTAGDAAFIDVLKSSTIDFSTTSFTLAAPITLRPSQTLTINVDSGTAIISGIISGSGNIIKTGNGTLQLTGVNTYTGTNTASAGLMYLAPLQLVDGQTYSTAMTLGANIIQPVQVAAGSSTISSVISGTGHLQKLGGGALTLSGANTFTGKVYFGDGTNPAGTIIANHATALGAGSGDITVNASALAVLNVAANFTSSRTTTLSSTLNVNVPTSTVTATLSGIISGGSTVTKSGAGKLILSGENTNSGGFTLSAGTLHLSNVAGAGTGTISTSGGTSIIMPTGTSIVANALALGSGRTTIYSTASTDVTTLSGIINGTGSLYKDGIGEITLTGANTFTGGTTMHAGTINVGVNNSTSVSGALGAGDSTVTIDGASTLSFLGNYALATGQDMVASAALGIKVSNGYTGTIAGDLSGTAIITKSGGGVLTLTPAATNSQSANFLITAGKVTMGSAGSIFGPGNAVISIEAGLVTNGAARTIANTGSSNAVYVLG